MSQKKVSTWRQALRVGALAATMVTGVAASATGCLNRPIERVEPRTTTTIVERLTQSSVDKIDLLLVIDNSRSMADKQEILNLAVPDLVNELINPKCVYEDGSDSPQQPASPLDDCPEAGTDREFDPILDIHIGILTSSIGSHGADACDTSAMMSLNFSVDDKAHLINRAGTDPGDPTVPTYQDLGFLVWDPDPETPSHNPPGETDSTNLINNLTQMVVGAGEVGCGYEATLEAWYRFLVEPAPYESITIENNSAVLEGIDKVIVGDGPNNPGQRQLFMRPDSLLAIIMLSDENDCSIRDGGQFYFASQIFQPGTNTPYHLPKPRAACAADPNDPCCRSCGQNPGDGCDTSQDDCSGSLSNLDDNINLRCYNQKQRFGIDFMWPIDRYVAGLTQFQVTDRYGNVADNPLFTDLIPGDDNSAVRDPGLVFIAGIVGVPWQDIARQDDAGNPNLLTGLDAEGEPVGGFQSGVELAANGTWDIILGDPSCYATSASCLPQDPHMIESVDPRSGQNPITGDTISPPGNLGSNINGSEYTIDQRDDLQYACIFDLQMDRDCSVAGAASCDCSDPANDNPLCQGTTQVSAKAYPGIRHLQLLRNVGTQGIVGSICPAQQTNNGSPDFGYRPAVQAIVDRLKQALGGQCLPRSLTPDVNGQVACLILEARNTGGGNCEAICNGENGRAFVPSSDPAVQAALEDPLAEAAGWDCFCQILQASNENGSLNACQTQTADPPVNDAGEAVHGWCYIDASRQPPIGNSDLVSSCPPTEQRIIRFVGDGQGVPGATLFITCSGE
ncbi:MAG TPA: hypothetical protein ENK57_24200 [Polyangiaceae bacterium]|nr:hypothetical protein [Polyangiaceae bacterium]